MDLVVATTNTGKLREIQALLDGAPVRLCPLADFPAMEEPEETGATFAENAALKAHAYAARLGLPVVAEDSGLEIDALGGEPGIHSARYPGATYPEKFAHLYARLAPFPRPWTARFVCELAFVEEGDVRFRSRGTVEGEIAPVPKGSAGFGYDPMFLYPPYGQTLGEVSGPMKLAVVHRGKAFRAFRAWLEETRVSRV
ncbi:MAG: RdgB/HAM1 family non-canonical purine NTP pyrophosphatase [Acidobacteria bacterium]|nr:RdgB/HAM1 family non-canonical purine NTP pyrophosphatase [Acidobacteriota bacterium]